GRLRLRSSSSARTLRAFDSVLQAVCSVHYDQRSLPRTTYTRLNEHYRPAVELAKLILRSSSFELRHGEVHAAAFLVDMNDVFENFVYVAVREALCLSERAFPQGGRGRRLFLDGAAKIELRPDLSWWDGERCTFIGDVKYKQAEAAGGPNADVYQLLAYTIATDLPGGLLVYGALRGEMVAHRIVNVGKDLAVAAIDLRGTPEEMLGQAKTITSQISRLRELARGDSLAVMA
ncbi:MAG TPA: hypothetical protein VJP78_01645, partial [Thermoleophilia bacterium]|nr:hypothetical protein [Thermoleophilia bacterium]